MKKLLALALVLVFSLALCVPAAAFSAQLSAQNLIVNGAAVACEKYNIDGSNYFKLRDLAMLLSGTGSQFDVGWDSVGGVVSITTGHPYTTATGHELEVGADNSAAAQPSAQTILIDGVLQSDLTVYNIGGSNFFMLRELGNKLGFAVDYDKATNTAIITSAPAEKPNVPGFSEQPTKENVLALLDAYDPDGAFILRQTDSSSGGGFGMSMDFTFWLFGSRNMADGVETAVHEQCHMMSHSKGWTDDYYVGSERSISVDYTEYFNSKEIIPLIPDRLKTSRYETYIADPDAPDEMLFLQLEERPVSAADVVQCAAAGEEFVGIVDRDQVDRASAEELDGLFVAAEDAVVGNVLLGVVVESGPDPRLERGFRSGERFSAPAELDADR